MKLSVLGCLLFAVNGVVAFAARSRDYSFCDGSLVYTILKDLSVGQSFCSPFLYSTGGATQTKTSTVMVKSCRATTTKTKLVHGTVTEFTQPVVATLSTVTLTEYSSTVLVPSGTHRSVNKRAPSVAALANAASYPTPTALLSCALEAISSGCSSLDPPHTKTVKVTTTAEEQCTSTATTTTTTFDRYTTLTYPITASPPPIIISTSATLTTTVPAACAGITYDSGGYVGDGNGVFPQSYPHFAQTGVECCVICYQTENCIASAFIRSALDCELLIRVNGTSPGMSKECPLGVYDYPFGTPHKPNIYPGPCGK